MEAFAEVGLPSVQAFDVFKKMDDTGNAVIDRVEWLHVIERASKSSGEEIDILADFVDKLARRQQEKGRIYDTIHKRRLCLILRHDSVLRMGWDLILTLLLFYVAMTVPFSLGFGNVT